MKKALFIVIFSFVVLAPSRFVVAQATNNNPTVRVADKSPDGRLAPTTAASSEAQLVPRNDSVNRGVVYSAPAASPLATTVTQTDNGEGSTSNKVVVADEAPLTEIYKVDVGDVLDIRLLNSAPKGSTLYSVIEGGLIDLPIAGGAISVAGLTTKDIQARITAELKRLAVDGKTQVAVGVRQYASHSVIITGLVGSPGTKFLRREAVPLYVLLAEVQPRLDAGRAAIMRVGAPTQVVDLGDTSSLNLIVRPGDVINVTARPLEFYYIAGRVANPGQKTFQAGVTLVQAILAAGGLARDNAVELSRADSGGRLTTIKFNLKEIKAGKINDPKIQAGDRIEVVH